MWTLNSVGEGKNRMKTAEIIIRTVARKVADTKKNVFFLKHFHLGSTWGDLLMCFKSATVHWLQIGVH